MVKKIRNLLLLLGLSVTFFAYLFPLPPPISLPAEKMIDPAARYLVFAPHSDDETLGVGGVIHEAVAAGATVHVVLVTNGDGFTEAVRAQTRKIRVSPADYLSLAKIRQKETLAALKILGLPANHVTLLGYPDRGIAPMWETYWDPQTPYLSPYTKTNYSPYDNSLTPKAPYAGLSLIHDIETMLLAYRPTVIIIPHPDDAHPDHWATANFVMYSLEELRAAGKINKDIAVYAYMVHRGDWPAPKGKILEAYLLPPKPMVMKNNWFQVPLPPETVHLKYNAILCYKSQIRLMKRYLDSFARKNELFTPVPITQPVTVKKTSVEIDGNVDDWTGIHPVLYDPIKDTLARRLEGGADFTQLFAACDQQNLYVRIDTRLTIHRSNSFVLAIKRIILGDTLASSNNELRFLLKPYNVVKPTGALVHPGKEIQVSIRKNHLEISLPLSLIGPQGRIFLGVTSSVSFAQVDRIPWIIISLPPEGEI